jgi:hypothetical protein
MQNPIFQALVKEAQFTKELLGAGATQIREVSYARKGVYFQALTSLSTGLERIGKLCLMLDHYIDNNGSFPEFKQLKSISHDISTIYSKTLEVKENRGIRSEFGHALDGEIYQNIISIISSFAQGDRYSNINLLVNARDQSDPIRRWYEEVDVPIFERCVTKAKKEKIERNARTISALTRGFTAVMHTSESGDVIDNVYDGSYLTGFQESVAPHRQRHIIHVIRFWTDIIWQLQYTAMELGRDDIPFFGEIFGGFNNHDSYIRTRKRWDTI